MDGEGGEEEWGGLEAGGSSMGFVQLFEEEGLGERRGSSLGFEDRLSIGIMVMIDPIIILLPLYII